MTEYKIFMNFLKPKGFIIKLVSKIPVGGYIILNYWIYERRKNYDFEERCGKYYEYDNNPLPNKMIIY
jgi:hypothetical protein